LESPTVPFHLPAFRLILLLRWRGDSSVILARCTQNRRAKMQQACGFGDGTQGIQRGRHKAAAETFARGMTAKFLILLTSIQMDITRNR